MFPTKGPGSYRHEDYEQDYQRTEILSYQNYQPGESTMRSREDFQCTLRSNNEGYSSYIRNDNVPQSGFNDESSSLALAYERRQREVEHSQRYQTNYEFNKMFERRNLPMATSYFNHDPLSVTDQPIIRNADNFNFARRTNAPVHPIIHNPEAFAYTNMRGTRHMDGNNDVDLQFTRRSQTQQIKPQMTFSEYLKQLNGPSVSDRRSNVMSSIGVPSLNESDNDHWNQPISTRTSSHDYGNFNQDDERIYRYSSGGEFSIPMYQQKTFNFARDNLKSNEMGDYDFMQKLPHQNSAFIQPDVVQVNPRNSIAMKPTEILPVGKTRQNVIPPSCVETEENFDEEEDYFDDYEEDQEDVEKDDSYEEDVENNTNEIPIQSNEKDLKDNKDERHQRLHNRFVNLCQRKDKSSDHSDEESGDDQEKIVTISSVSAQVYADAQQNPMPSGKFNQSGQVAIAVKIEPKQSFINPFAIRIKSGDQEKIPPLPIKNEEIDIFEPVEKELKKNKVSLNQNKSHEIKNQNIYKERIKEEKVENQKTIERVQAEVKRKEEEKIVNQKIMESVQLKALRKEQEKAVAKEPVEKEHVVSVKKEKVAEEQEIEILKPDKLICSLEPLPNKKKRSLGKYVAFVSSKNPVTEDTIREIEIERELMKIKAITYDINLDFQKIGVKIVEDSAKEENEKVKKSLSKIDKEINQSVQLIKEWEAVKLFEKQRKLARQAEEKNKNLPVPSTSQLFNKVYEKVKASTPLEKVKAPPPPKLSRNEISSEDEYDKRERERKSQKNYEKELNDLTSATQLSRKRYGESAHSKDDEYRQEKMSKGHSDRQRGHRRERHYSSSDSDNSYERRRERRSKKDRDRYRVISRDHSPDKRVSRYHNEESCHKRSSSSSSKDEKAQKSSFPHREPQVTFIITDEDTTTPKVTRVLKEDTFKEVNQNMDRRSGRSGSREWSSYYEDKSHSFDYSSRSRDSYGHHHSSYAPFDRYSFHRHCDRTPIYSDKDLYDEEEEQSSKRPYRYSRDEEGEDEKYVPSSSQSSKTKLYTLPRFTMPGRGTGYEIRSGSSDSDPVPCDISEIEKRERYCHRRRAHVQEEEVTMIPRVTIDPINTGYRSKRAMVLMNAVPTTCEHCGKTGLHRSVDCWFRSQPDPQKIYKNKIEEKR